MGNMETRQWKSNTFSLLMKEKQYAMETYNALNETEYDDPELIDVLLLDGGFSLSVRNDAAFIVDSVVNMYEHQSTKNPNMPLRFLIYTANMYRYLTRNMDIFGDKLLKLPKPRFIVFYNGMEKYPEEQELRLSDAYENLEEEPLLELKCRILNINPGYNEKLKERCSGLKGYCTYVEKARKYRKNMEIHLAIARAIDECVEDGILADFFKENRDMIISADAIDGTIERRMKFAEERGMERGIERGTRMVIEGALRKGNTPEAIAKINDMSIETILEVQKEMLEEA